MTITRLHIGGVINWSISPIDNQYPALCPVLYLSCLILTHTQTLIKSMFLLTTISLHLTIRVTSNPLKIPLLQNKQIISAKLTSVKKLQIRFQYVNI